MQVDHSYGARPPNNRRRSRSVRAAWVTAVLLAAVASACEEPAPSEVTRAVGPSAPITPATPTEASLSGPPTGLVAPPLGQERLEGVVARRLPAGGYTYLQVELEHGEPRWVVTMRRDVAAGDRVRVDNLGSRHDFYSRRLDRRFAELVFGVVEVLG